MVSNDPRQLVRAIALGTLTCAMVISEPVLSGAEAPAQGYPSKSVTIVVPWPAGNAPDSVARMLAPKLADRLGKPFIVENRPGAGSIVGATSVARAEPDGHTLLVGGNLTTAPPLHKNLPYDARKDFVPVALVASVPFVLVVNPSLPVRSVAELIKLAKDKPNWLSYGSGGPGSPPHIFAEMLKSMAGIEMVHVPYKGGGLALNDVVAGHIPLAFVELLPSQPLITEGKLRALAVSSSTRVASSPEIPTMAEAGLSDFNATAWIMFVARAGTPTEIVSRLNAELKPMLAAPEMQQWLVKNGMIPANAAGPEEVKQFLGSEIARWGAIVERIGLAGSQ